MNQTREILRIQLRQLRLGNEVYGTRHSQLAQTVFGMRKKCHDALADSKTYADDPPWVKKGLSMFRRASVKRYRTRLPYDRATYWGQHKGQAIFVCRNKAGTLLGGPTPAYVEELRDAHNAIIDMAKAEK